MKKWRRVLSCFLAVLLTVYLVPVQVMAEELGDLWPPTTENVVDAPAEVVGEILEQREENRKEFLLTDGTRQVVIYPAAVHYQKDGYWEEIDNRLLPSAAQDGETVWCQSAFLCGNHSSLYILRYIFRPFSGRCLCRILCLLGFFPFSELLSCVQET